MELSTYFRINASETGQFERTLIVAEEGSYVSYLEGCTAPKRDEHQLHAAVVELVALENAEIKYSTVQNWYPGDEEGRGGIYNFVTKRGDCRGRASKIPGRRSKPVRRSPGNIRAASCAAMTAWASFIPSRSRTITSRPTPARRCLHLGKNTRSRIVSKGISAGKRAEHLPRLGQRSSRAENARNHTQCDSLLIGSHCGAHTVPYIESRNPTAKLEHEATTSKISDDQLFYCLARGIPQEEAVAIIVNGFCRDVLQQLPMEFAVEAQKLVGISLEGSVG
jgi:Fe-S cluster assembly protein SufB